jgi:octaprenyl-diphosphate synthase
MNQIEIIKQPILDELKELHVVMDQAFDASNPLLSAVLDYIKKRRGKMMRPVLMLLIAKSFGPVQRGTYLAASTLELLHNASLVHDDVVDESDERRGQPSVKAIYNNKVSILVGDYLVAVALQQSIPVPGVVETLAQLSRDLSEGEILQLMNISKEELTEESYMEVIRKKTAELFAACARLAASTAGASAEEVEKFRRFGEKLGICFQIKDDIFDYYHDERIGKPTGNDLREGKITLPLLHVLLTEHNEQAWALVPKVKAQLATSEEIEWLIAYTKERGGITYAEEVMAHFRAEALALLSGIRDEAVRRALETFLTYVIEREK